MGKIGNHRRGRPLPLLGPSSAELRISRNSNRGGYPWDCVRRRSRGGDPTFGENWRDERGARSSLSDSGTNFLDLSPPYLDGATILKEEKRGPRGNTS